MYFNKKNQTVDKNFGVDHVPNLQENPARKI